MSEQKHSYLFTIQVSGKHHDANTTFQEFMNVVLEFNKPMTAPYVDEVLTMLEEYAGVDSVVIMNYMKLEG